jgi:hypothetical protein
MAAIACPMLKRVGFGVVIWLSVLSGCSGQKTKDRTTGGDGGGGGSCECALDWQIDNLAPCIRQHTAFTDTLIYSSSPDEGGGQPHCDVGRSFPQPVPSREWSGQRISSSCTGSGTLVLRVRQGDGSDPSPDDCIIAEQQVEFDYTTADQPLSLPALKPWSAQDQACARAYEEQGGYFEFRVESSEVGCGEDGHTVKYAKQCPVTCTLDASGPECEDCGAPTLTNSF